MEQHQSQHYQQHHLLQQGQQQASHAPIAPNPGGMVASSVQTLGAQSQGMLMGLMTNPALAAAAAGSPLFPPAAMLTNPGAFFAMPDVYTSAGPPAAPTIRGHMQQTSIAPQGMQGGLNISGAATMYTDALGNQVQHIQAGPQHMTQMQLSSQPGAAPPNASMHVHMVAAATASQGVAENYEQYEQYEQYSGNDKKRRKEMSAAERAKQNRDRNREHAKSTRLRKKAYVQKLKELVEGLHAERTEEVRQRRVAIQHLAEMQSVRRSVIASFLQFHTSNERDKRKWSTLLEDDFWMKQPVTPYRCFRRSEIEQECRMSRGLDAVIADAASTAVMIEGVGSRNTRWMQIKREDFFLREEERTGTKIMPQNVVRQNGRFQHAISSLSSSSANSSNTGSSGEDSKRTPTRGLASQSGTPSPPNVSSSSSSCNDKQKQKPNREFHDYHAQPLPDPKLRDSERGSSSPSEDSPEESNTSAEDIKRVSTDSSSADYHVQPLPDSERGSSSPSEDSPEESNTSAEDTKRVSTDSSSGDDSAAAIQNPRPSKRHKHDGVAFQPNPGPTAGAAAAAASSVYLPQNIAKKGGISHNVRPVSVQFPPAPRNGNACLSVAPAVSLAGLGKRPQAQPIPPKSSVNSVPSQSQEVVVHDSAQLGAKVQDPQNYAADKQSMSVSGEIEGRAVIISGDVETSSTSNSSNNKAQTRSYYHINEDDMILMEDILMCPFVFRTQEAVNSGALAECVMPGMLRAYFSSRNKLQSLEMTYDAMGFMQQLERASGSEMTAQIIPGSLEMALSPSTTEARIITLVDPPYQIVSVNEPWTKLTKRTQMEVEGMELFKALEGEVAEDVTPSAPYDLEGVREGRCTCATRLHYDKDGEQFVDFINSYPLTNTNDEITHILHISKELPTLQQGSVEDSVMDEEA